MSVEFAYTAKTAKSFDEAVASIEKETEQKGFKTLHIHDFGTVLKEKGFPREPIKVLEICSAKHANLLLQAEVKISLLLPCRIVVYVENGEVNICAFRPILFPKLYPETNIQSLVEEIDQVICSIVDRAK